MSKFLAWIRVTMIHVITFDPDDDHPGMEGLEDIAEFEFDNGNRGAMVEIDEFKCISVTRLIDKKPDDAPF